MSEPESLARIKGIVVRASIDGSESAHNAIRRNKTGENAYRDAMENLGNARKEGVKIQVTCSVNRMNYDTIYEMVADARQRGLTMCAFGCLCLQGLQLQIRNILKWAQHAGGSIRRKQKD